MSIVDPLCAAVSTWLPFVQPALLLLWFESCPPSSVRRAFSTAADLTGVSLAITARGWYARPDYASSPVAALGAAALLIVPALLALTTVHQAFRREGRNRRYRVVYSLGIGYGVFFGLMVPAMLLFVSLGGDTL